MRLGSQYQIYDPATIAPAPNGRFSRQPFAGNLIPAARFDPMGKKLMGCFPLPSEVGTSDGRNNYSDPQARVIDYNSQMARVDQAFRERQRLYGALSWSYLLESLGGALNHAMFAAPNAVPTNALFGQGNSIVATDQRRITFGGKLSC